MIKTLGMLSGLCMLIPIQAQTYTIKELFGFQCSQFSCPDGQAPNAIMQASDGNFYGVANGANVINGGTIFKITASGQFTLLYTFPYNGRSDLYPNGSQPGSITEGSDGMLYGTANAGGPTSASSGDLWRINKNGSGFQILEQFCTSCASGSFPDYIVAASDGNLYGTTSSGGIFPSNGTCSGLGCGVIFRLTTGGAYTVLHAFNSTTETSYPIGITQATDGNFYGGTANESGGALFRITPSGAFTLLSGFSGGAYALAPLTQASDGLLYGYSHVISAGTIELFSLSLSGLFSDVVQITQPLYKQYGVGKILQASDGNLWSTAVEGGPFGYGQVFAVTTSGATVANVGFNGTDGSFPVSGVSQTTSGTLYGVTAKLGKTGSGGWASGEVYSLTGLPPR